jgi:hypothetical protein
LRTNDIEGVQLTSGSVGAGGTGLNKNSRIMAKLISFRRSSAVANVEMAGEKDVHTDTGESRHSPVRPAYQVLTPEAFRKIEWMVSDYDPDQVGGNTGEISLDALNLLLIDPAALDRKSSGSIQADNCNLLVGVEGMNVSGNIPVIVVKTTPESRIQVNRNIVVAGYDDLRPRQRIEECACAFELLPFGALCQIARNRNHVGIDLPNRRLEFVDCSLMGAPKVDIGDMDNATNASLLGYQDT